MRRVAVLIDGDNVSAIHAERIRTIASAVGRIDVHRTYVNAANGSNWSSIAGVEVIHAGTGKNAADLLLAIDALELALTRGIDAFVLASSDSDFTHIANRLRAHGRVVIGVGETKAPEAFRASCTEFERLDPPQSPVATSRASTAKELDLKVRSLIAAHSDKGRGMPINLLGPQMNRLHGTRISTYPERTWRAYFAARPDLYDLEPRGPEAHVRFRREGFPD